MSEQLGPLEIECDAPPYAIVQASTDVGILKPADVRWCRINRFRHQTSAWGKVLGLGRSQEETCTCGQPLPELVSYRFTLNTGEQMSYLLGQCGRCRTVFWH